MQVEFKIETAVDARALEAFLAVKFPAEPVTKLQSRKSAAKTEVATKPKPEPVAKPKPEPRVEDAKIVEEGVTLEQIRSELAKKVKLNKVEIKAKLEELGAPNLTKLDKEHYQTMYDYLTNLKNIF